MTSRAPNDPAAVPPALTAFLRGAERRGAVFAELQVGDAEAGDRALVSAMRAFRLAAAQVPVADWPRQFWSLLLAAPDLRAQPPSPTWGNGFAFLAGVGRGPRAALLLRLVAGLGEQDAAGVLGIARPTYRLALQRALPHRDDGQPDADAWRLLGEAAQQAVRDLSANRLAHLARLREAAISGRRIEPVVPIPVAPPVPTPGDAVRRRWTFPAMALVATLALVAFGMTFVPRFAGLADDPNAPRIGVAPLPPADAPAATYDADAALLTQPDFDQILGDPVDAPSRDPAFYAWLAAGSPDSQIEHDQASADDAPVSPPVSVPPPSTADAPVSESEDAPL